MPNTTIASKDVGDEIRFSNVLAGTKYNFWLYYTNSSHHNLLAWTVSITTGKSKSFIPFISVSISISAMQCFQTGFDDLRVKVLSFHWQIHRKQRKKKKTLFNTFFSRKKKKKKSSSLNLHLKTAYWMCHAKEKKNPRNYDWILMVKCLYLIEFSKIQNVYTVNHLKTVWEASIFTSNWAPFPCDISSDYIISVAPEEIHLQNRMSERHLSHDGLVSNLFRPIAQLFPSFNCLHMRHAARKPAPIHRQSFKNKYLLFLDAAFRNLRFKCTIEHLQLSAQGIENHVNRMKTKSTCVFHFPMSVDPEHMWHFTQKCAYKVFFFFFCLLS